MGFRVPAMAFSPYLRRGHVDHGVYGHESILKMIEERFGLNPLTKLGFDYRDARPEDVFREPHRATAARLSGMEYDD